MKIEFDGHHPTLGGVITYTVESTGQVVTIRGGESMGIGFDPEVIPELIRALQALGVKA